MKLGMKEAMIGIILLVVGAFWMGIFFEEFLKVILGMTGPLLLLLGFLITWIGFEDMREGI